MYRDFITDHLYFLFLLFFYDLSIQLNDIFFSKIF
jgi:hypothetical protein